MLNMKQRRQITTSDPTTWAPDPTTMLPDPMGRRRPTAARGGVSGLTPTASIAAKECPPAETGGGDTATMPIVQPPTNNGDGRPNTPDSDGLTLPSTKRQLAANHCEQCGGDFTPRRSHGRFCSSYCRRLAWLGRNPEKAAELAARDRQRLREYVIGCGGEWHDGGYTDGA